MLKEVALANPFLVLGGVAVGIIVAAFGVLQVPGWVASAQDAAAINDLSNINTAQAIYRSVEGVYADNLGALSGAATTDADIDNEVRFRLSGGVELTHLDANTEGDAYCAVVKSASGLFFAGSESKNVSPASRDAESAMNSVECLPGTRGEPVVNPADTTMAFTLNTTAAGCTAPGLNLGSETPAAVINWGDGSSTTATSGANRHTYENPGAYTVTVKGTIPTFGSMGTLTAACIESLDKWGADTGTRSTAFMFENAQNLRHVAPPPATVTNMSGMFHTAIFFNGDVSGWDVSNVEDMSMMFMRANDFNQPLAHWNVSNVKTMNSMFHSAEGFSQDLRSWDVSHVEDFSNMFSTAAYNLPLDGWDTSSATTMAGMFSQNHGFNQNLSSWDVSKVKTMKQMFENASAFNGKLEWKDTSSLTNTSSMFSRAYAFNQNLTSWKVHNVTDMSFMFRSADGFRGDVSGWKTTSLQNVASMFYQAAAFNGNLQGWDVTKVTSYSQFNTLSGLSQANVPAKIFTR